MLSQCRYYQKWGVGVNCSTAQRLTSTYVSGSIPGLPINKLCCKDVVSIKRKNKYSILICSPPILTSRLLIWTRQDKEKPHSPTCESEGPTESHEVLFKFFGQYSKIHKMLEEYSPATLIVSKCIAVTISWWSLSLFIKAHIQDFFLSKSNTRSRSSTPSRSTKCSLEALCHGKDSGSLETLMIPSMG